ncbi:MAG: hypothetical protein H7228_15955 [Polaromonas sp.]|nr:hypothetical protein [Polaromonas sp.]
MSNLILDPDLDSYYLMEAVLLKLPDAAGLLLQARLLAQAEARAMATRPDHSQPQHWKGTAKARPDSPEQPDRVKSEPYQLWRRNRFQERKNRPAQTAAYRPGAVL